MRLRVLPFVFLSAVLLSVPSAASAQGFISPFVGFDFGGNSGCQTAADCEDKNSNIGVAFGGFGPVVGFEAELGYARDFFGETPGVSSNVLTFMSNLMIGPKIGPVRPYVVGGLGLVKTNAELTGGSLLSTSNNSFGWDFGGGVMIFFGEHIGVRGDLRRFSTFDEEAFLGFPFSLGEESLTFNRAAAALVLAF